MKNVFFDDEIIDIEFDFGIYLEIKDVKFYWLWISKYFIKDLKMETIAITVYSIVSTTLLVDVDECTYEQKCKIINDVAMDVYDADSEIGDIYEKVHDVRFADFNKLLNNVEYAAVLNADGDYELVQK